MGGHLSMCVHGGFARPPQTCHPNSCSGFRAPLPHAQQRLPTAYPSSLCPLRDKVANPTAARKRWGTTAPTACPTLDVGP